MKPEDNRFKSDWIESGGLSLVSITDSVQGRSDDDAEPVQQVYIRTAQEVEGGRHGVLETCESKWYLVPPKDLEPQPHPEVAAKLPMNHHHHHQPPLSLVFGKMPSDTLLNSVSVALLPRIYVLGGGFSDSPSRQVLSYDITSPHRGWERRPNMNFPRFRPSAVALDGKVYVFGGVDWNWDSTLPFGEVYDPESDTWQVLVPGDASMDQHTVCPGGHAIFMDKYRRSKHLLVRSMDTFYTYDVSAGWFSLREHSTPPFSYHGEDGAIVDGILYACDENRIVAYDLVKGEWFDEPVHGLSSLEYVFPGSTYRAFLFHIGNGRLCIAYGSPIYDFSGEIPNKMRICCSVFRVSRRRMCHHNRNGKATLHASLDSFKCYTVPGNNLHDCLVL